MKALSGGQPVAMASFSGLALMLLGMALRRETGQRWSPIGE
jgi:hypothetical protein